MTSPNIDWQTTQVTLPGLSTPIYARYEYTSSEVAVAFNDYLKQIADVFNIPSDPNANPPVNIGSAEVTTVTTALNDLYSLAQNGIVTDGKKYYLNTEMASSLDALARTFMAAGFPVPGVAGVGDPIEALKRWKDLSILSPVVTEILRVGLDTYASNRSLQALIELEYVKNANDLLEGRMGSLEEALSTTKDIINTLAEVQSIHNKLVISSKPSINFNYLSDFGSPNNYINAYTKVASNYFGGPILVQIPNIGDYQYRYEYNNDGDITGREATNFAFNATGQEYINNLIKYRASIVAQISHLDTILSAQQKSETGGIYSALTNVLKDLDSTFQANGVPITEDSTNLQKYNGFVTWMFDRYNEKNSADSGVYQENISKAITAAQSLNDTQKEDVRNYLFVFEEYYKSASAILQKITQILERMAQGIRN